MPVISVFLGIIIRMFYQEHEPPHFHAEHQSDQAKFGFDGSLLAGGLRSRTAVSRVRQWAALHRRELDANWENMKAGRPLERIPPLEQPSLYMTFLPLVTEAKYRGGYRIHVVFNDRSEATVDFRRWLRGPVFAPLKDLDYFRRFFVDGGTVAWPNGADIAPETLYGSRRTRPNKRLKLTSAHK